MGYPGYPQQPNWQGGGGYYPQQQNYPGPVPDQGNPALAVITGIIGLGIVGVLVWQTLDLMSMIGDAPGLPEVWHLMNIAHFVVAGILLIGAVLVFLRLIAGAFVLLVGALLTLLSILLAPLIVEDVALSMIDVFTRTDFVPATGNYGDYFKAMFEFGNEQAVLRFVVLVLAVILLITAALPPSLNWLRRPRQNGYTAQQPGW